MSTLSSTGNPYNMFGYTKVGVVVPVHNESRRLIRCLDALLTASSCVPAEVRIAVVLDDCTDGSRAVTDQYGDRVDTVRVCARNVGAARAAGFDFLLDRYGAGDQWWYATSDADSEVDADWIIRQVARPADMYVGLVRVVHWEGRSPELADRYEREYRARIGVEHDHVHGANMGFDAMSYWQVGGFDSLNTGEDVDLVNRFEDARMRIFRDTTFTVTTSARMQGRAPLGFSQHLNVLDETGEVPDSKRQSESAREQCA